MFAVSSATRNFVPSLLRVSHCVESPGQPLACRWARQSFNDNVPRFYSISTSPKVAVLYQEIDPPVINGVQKPKKPGGYRDSGADIAYVLHKSGVGIVTPEPSPNPRDQEGWCFPDTEAGIVAAVEKGATHLWANTILFETHPLQTSTALDHHASQIRVVGQPPRLVDKYDDKSFVNSLLRKDGSFPLPRFWILESSSHSVLGDLSYPAVGKPIRGRGSHGVKVCFTEAELSTHLEGILRESPIVMVEEYLSGIEGTVTVMPKSDENPSYWSMPFVVRFNHENHIAPYNGVVAVTANSRVLSDEELKQTPAYEEVSKHCERVAEKLKATAPIRVDVRRYNDHDPDAKFAIFDVNMKPNMTGPGRPEREDQASLTALAAARLGWDYPELLKHILGTAQTLEHLRSIKI